MNHEASISQFDVPSAPPWIGSAHQRLHIDLQWLTVTLALPGAAVVFFGLRGLGMMLAVVLAAAMTHAIVLGVRRLFRRAPSRVAHAHMLTLALLLGAALPLFVQPWVAMVAGGMLGIFAHLVGRSHRLRVHPVALVLTVLWLAPILWPALASHRDLWAQFDAVLRPQRLVVGDGRDATQEVSPTAWWSPAEEPMPDALRRRHAGLLILADRHELLQDRAHLVHLISTGQLVRLEELFVGAHIDAAGASSRAVLVFLGFYLMYRRLAYWQTAAAAGAAAMVAMLVMPAWTGQAWTLTIGALTALGPAAAVTFIAYFLFATPLVFIVMVLAPMSAPMSSAGRIVYGGLLGSSAVALMWLLSQPQAAYAALLFASCLSRPLDALQRSAFVR